ncbi:hypothetical protein RvY_11341 [Ramazzottius varieornatus]|uniref:Uncharacterized protein n=1 Tax=Ramazzottius varieornatus TaxID=947166 RepID=A0A1D1VFV0_RAMVA|nr:hypothetical protein RvY_11341 [Ramazzottius varieornatus]
MAKPQPCVTVPTGHEAMCQGQLAEIFILVFARPTHINSPSAIRLGSLGHADQLRQSGNTTIDVAQALQMSVRFIAALRISSWYT